MPIPSYDESWLTRFLQYDSKRHRGLILPKVAADGTEKPWEPGNESGKRLLGHIIAVFNEYQEFWPLSIRQVYYRCVGRWPEQYRKDEWLEKDKDDGLYYWKHGDLADKVERIIGDARRAGRIPWDIVRDDGIIASVPAEYESMGRFWATIYEKAQHYQSTLLVGQDVHPEIWCEAAGMVPQLERIAFQYGVPVYSSGGTTSLTIRREAAVRFAERKVPTYVCHLGDHDPSGVMVYNSLREDVVGLGADLNGPKPHFRRLAITEAQIATHLTAGQTQPPKGADGKRGKWGNKPCAQAEALPPDVLAQIVTDALEECLDMDLLRDTKLRGRQEKESILDQVAQCYVATMEDEDE